MNKEPRYPCRQSAQVQRVQVGHRFVAADCRHAALIEVPEALWFSAFYHGQNIACGVTALLHRDRRNARQRVAIFAGEIGNPLPGVSAVAMQQGRHAARNILAMIEGRKPQRFWYFDKGSMATIGRHKAVADLHPLHLSGLPAWLAWLFVHILFLVGFRNRVVVLFQWAWAYFTFNKGARLITRNFQAETRPPA